MQVISLHRGERFESISNFYEKQGIDFTLTLDIPCSLLQSASNGCVDNMKG